MLVYGNMHFLKSGDGYCLHEPTFWSPLSVPLLSSVRHLIEGFQLIVYADNVNLGKLIFSYDTSQCLLFPIHFLNHSGLIVHIVLVKTVNLNWISIVPNPVEYLPERLLRNISKNSNLETSIHDASYHVFFSTIK